MNEHIYNESDVCKNILSSQNCHTSLSLLGKEYGVSLDYIIWMDNPLILKEIYMFEKEVIILIL